MLASGKTGVGVHDLLEAVVHLIPSPEGNAEGPLRALIFDSYFDPYRGVVALVRVVDGSIKKGDEVIGNETRVKVVKNKVAPPFKTAEVDIMYGEGISKTGELIDMAVEKEIVKKSGSWFSYGEERIGQGRENAKKYMKEHPEDWNAARVTDDTLFMQYPWFKEKRKNDISHKYNWTQTEVSQMKMLRKQGFTIREIAEKMNRSESSIKYKLYGREKSNGRS